METIKEVLMRRDGLTETEAEDAIEELRTDFQKRMARNDYSCMDIMEEYFGLEPDYLDELIYC